MFEKLKFTIPDTEEEVEFFVVEQTQINNLNYLLVTESTDEDSDSEAQAYILKDLSNPTDEDAQYVMVEEDEELETVSQVFAQLLDDLDLV